MFDVLSKGFKAARLKLQGKTELNEANLAEALREVRTSLIQADVEINVAKGFVERVKAKSLGEIVPLQLPGGQQMPVSPMDWFIKHCYDELVELMGPVDASLDLDGHPAVIMMVGLQGGGKTTTAAKIARKLMRDGKKPMLVAADIYRPAAVDQLTVLGRKLSIPVFSIKGMNPVQLSKMALTQARNVGRDVLIIDTAGRLAIDDTLMKELEQIKAETQPKNILFVADAMIGQDAVKTAAEFDRRLSFTGFVLTKLDGDARGGAALSIKTVTGKPVKFLGEGETLDKLEEFRPEGLAQRILGFGDVVGLMQDFEKHVDQKEAEATAEKMLAGQFTYDDFVSQLKMLRRMGSFRSLMAKMPFFTELMDQIPDEALDDRNLDLTLAIIGSMTKEERRNPDVMSPSRMARIAKGTGRNIEAIEELHKRFLQARSMMKGMGEVLANPGKLEQMQRDLQRMMGVKPEKPAKPEPTVDEKLARRQKQLEARRARKHHDA